MKTEAYEYEEEIVQFNLDKDEDKDKDKKEDKKEVSKKEESSSDEMSETEQAAYAQGWRKKNDWKGDPKKWVDADDFLFRGELMDRIQKQTKVINDLKNEAASTKEALRVLGEHNKQIAEKEYARAIKALKRQRAEAAKEDDYDTVSELEDQIEELKDAKDELKTTAPEKKESKKEEEVKQAPPEVEEWVSKNSGWYEKNDIMTGAADRIAMRHLNANPEDWSGALEEVDKRMREEFPEEFGLTKNKRGAVTETDGRANSSKKSGKSNKKYSPKDLNEEQFDIARTFEAEGVMSKQEYVDQLAELGELDAQQQ